MYTRRAEDVETVDVTAGSNTSMQVLIGADEAPNFAMRRFRIGPGGEMPPHTNEVEHEQYVLSGRATVGIADEIHEVAPGSVVHIPACVPHWYRTNGDEPFVFLCLVPNLPDQIRLVD
jgi:quercetin dioxygenase-like cupin family protein